MHYRRTAIDCERDESTDECPAVDTIAVSASLVEAERTGSIGSGREPLAGMGVKCRPVVTAMTSLARRHISLLGRLAC
jgi:hypothetical protein